MTRVALLITALAGGWLSAPVRADVEIAPPPREVRADGSRTPAPEPARREDPAETVDRIIKTSKAVGDKLAETDTGTDTRAKQDQILKDIDTLLNPPPQSGGGGGENDKNNQKNQDKNNSSKKNESDPSGGSDGMPKGDKKDDKKDDKNSSGGSDGMPKDNPGMPPPKSDQKGNSGMPPPQPGQNGGGGKDGQKDAQQQANGGGHRPRKGGPGQQPKDAGPPPHGGKPSDGDMAKGQQPPQPTDQPLGPPLTAGTGGTKPAGKMAVRSLPLEDEVVKEVWGHLPDKLRQQVTQYYKEQFMPRYSDLLKQYYSSLATSPQKSGEGRK